MVAAHYVNTTNNYFDNIMPCMEVDTSIAVTTYILLLGLDMYFNGRLSCLCFLTAVAEGVGREESQVGIFIIILVIIIIFHSISVKSSLEVDRSDALPLQLVVILNCTRIRAKAARGSASDAKDHGF